MMPVIRRLEKKTGLAGGIFGEQAIGEKGCSSIVFFNGY